MEERKISSQQIVHALQAEGVPENTISAFLEYHRTNPDIWTSFEEKALEIIGLGLPHYGAGAIAEVIRYERLKQGRDGFKINNNYRAYYARVFEVKWPEHKGFFETRKVQGLANQ